MKFEALTTILSDESGATAIEYGLIAALVSVVAVASLKGMGTSLSTMFSKVAGELSTATTTTPTP